MNDDIVLCAACEEVGKTYEIQSRVGHEEWSTDGVGRTGNEFDTIDEAVASIESLRLLGWEWARAHYRVVER